MRRSQWGEPLFCLSSMAISTADSGQNLDSYTKCNTRRFGRGAYRSDVWLVEMNSRCGAKTRPLLHELGLTPYNLRSEGIAKEILFLTKETCGAF